MKSKEITHIKNLIAENRIYDALKKSMDGLSNPALKNQVIMLMADFNNLNEKIRAGILTTEHENIGRNTIVYSLMELLVEIELGDGFSSGIKLTMQELNKKVERLTNDQYELIRSLRGFKKLRVAGCAGSGKTLVAAEKANRLSQAGLKTLFLCHNPYLADHIKKLVRKNPVEVSSFGNWVRKLNQEGYGTDPHWSNVYEPTEAELNSAFDKIEKFDVHYDAIIVDEGQDFRQDWWTLVEFSLRDSSNSILYIFHDDNQALLPFRANYPINSPPFDLSKNCRNGGKIYELMKELFHHQAPTVSAEMNNEGEVKIFTYEYNFYKNDFDRLHEAISEAIKWMIESNRIDQFVILLAGNISVYDWNLSSLLLKTPNGKGWKAEMKNQLNIAIKKGQYIKFRENKEWLENEFNAISNNDIPTKEDIEQVEKIIKAFEVESTSKNTVIQHAEKKPRIYWKEVNGQLKLFVKRREVKLLSAEMIMFFQDPEWVNGIWTEKQVNFKSTIKNIEGDYPVFNTSSYKGLESDGVILVSNGKNDSLLNELYVGVSRAKGALAVVIDTVNARIFDTRES